MTTSIRPIARLTRLLALALALTGLTLALSTGVAGASHSGTTVLVDASDGAADGDPADCGSASNPCNTIAAAISHANSGDTVQVAAGTYQESLTINKTLTLVGAGAANTVIDADGADNVLHIQGNNVAVRGFTLRGARLDGVLFDGAQGGSIRQSTVTANATLVIPPPEGAPPGTPPTVFNGVNLRNSSGIIVENNNISNNPGGRGVRTEGSAVYMFPEHGLNVAVVGRSDNNVIRNNVVNDNGGGCGIVISTDSSGNLVEGNTVQRNPAGIIISGLPPFGLPGTPFADHIPESSNNRVRNNIVRDNALVGINVNPITGIANNNRISHNEVSGNGPAEGLPNETVGIKVFGGTTPSAQAIGNIVGDGNLVTGQSVGIWVGGTAVGVTTVSQNQAISVTPGGTRVLIQAEPEAEPTPTPPPSNGGGLPSVGDDAVPSTALGALVAGALALSTGLSLALRRRRSEAGR